MLDASFGQIFKTRSRDWRSGIRLYESSGYVSRTMRLALSRSTLFEMLIWSLLAFLCFAFIWNWRPTPLSDDSYQYLNVADNVSHGRGIVTTLVHFDSERSHGRVP